MFNGTANILKPPGISSFALIKHLRWLLDEKKAGHTGTLDPAAAGVLGVCFGKATKTIPFLDDSTKTYICEMKLGMQTDTLDLEGEVLKEDLNWNKLKTEEIIEVLNRFKGRQNQIPPMYSAVHHQGKRLYKLARKGISVEREAREVNVFSLEIIKIELPILRLKLKVSRGTYIRSLIRDIGEELGSAAVLSFLLRTQSGPFNIEDAVTVEDIEKKGTDILLQTHQPLDLPKYTVKDSSIFRAENGNYLLDKDFVEEKIELEIGDYFMVFSEADIFLSINQYIKKDDYLIYQPVKVFI